VSRQKASERLAWAVDVLDVGPGNRLLEVGCGHGVAVSLVCEKLDGGHITAIDRSAKMIEAARKRNARCVATGVASFQTASLHEAGFGDALFDKIFAIHVPVLLRGRPGRELEIIGQRLAPGGGFYLPFQPLDPEQAKPTTERLATMLESHGFRVRDTLVKDLSIARVGCVIAGKGPL
jgi:SAM-dependent methyltransferase